MTLIREVHYNLECIRSSMIAKSLDLLEKRIDHLQKLVGIWKCPLENEEQILTAVDFLERSIESIYLETYELTEELYQLLDRFVTRYNPTAIYDDDNMKVIDIQFSICRENIESLNLKLKQMDDIYCNKFLKRLNTFNDIPANHIVTLSKVIKKQEKIKVLIHNHEDLLVKSMIIFRKYIDYSKKFEKQCPDKTKE